MANWASVLARRQVRAHNSPGGGFSAANRRLQSAARRPAPPPAQPPSPTYAHCPAIHIPKGDQRRPVRTRSHPPGPGVSPVAPESAEPGAIYRPAALTKGGCATEPHLKRRPANSFRDRRASFSVVDCIDTASIQLLTQGCVVLISTWIAASSRGFPHCWPRAMRGQPAAIRTQDSAPTRKIHG